MLLAIVIDPFPQAAITERNQTGTIGAQVMSSDRNGDGKAWDHGEPAMLRYMQSSRFNFALGPREEEAQRVEFHSTVLSL